MDIKNQPKSPQARILRGILFRKTLLYLLLYTACFALLAIWANSALVPQIANTIADRTSEWLYYNPEQYDAFMQNATPEQLYNLQVYSGTTEDGTTQYALRDLTIYNTLSSFKIPTALCLFFLGALGIAFIMLNKSLQYFDTLSYSVAKLLTDKDPNVDLPEDLSIVRSELTTLKKNSLAAEQHALDAEKRKNELVAYLAHDIRTPLTSILGYLSLLKEPETLPNPERKHYAEIALNKAEHLEELIEELFEITRYNLQSIPLERENFNVELFCQQIADDFYPEAKQKNVTIEVCVTNPSDTTADTSQNKSLSTSSTENSKKLNNHSSDNLVIFADPEKLARAASNVLRNALAYAEPKSIIKLEIIQAPKGTIIAIQNKGKEISPTHLQSIFEKFFREDSSRNSKQGGAGLGLAIAKEIMLAHGGDITATSEQGITTFRLFIPKV